MWLLQSDWLWHHSDRGHKKLVSWPRSNFSLHSSPLPHFARLFAILLSGPPTKLSVSTSHTLFKRCQNVVVFPLFWAFSSLTIGFARFQLFLCKRSSDQQAKGCVFIAKRIRVNKAQVHKWLLCTKIVQYHQSNNMVDNVNIQPVIHQPSKVSLLRHMRVFWALMQSECTQYSDSLRYM